MKNSIKIAFIAGGLFKVALMAGGLLMAGNIANAQQKLGHINYTEVLEAMPEMKTANVNLQTFAKAKQTTLEQMDAERQKKLLTYQEKAKTVSEANKEIVGKELETLGKEIQDMEKRIIDTQQKSRDEIMTKQSELYEPVYKKVNEAIKVVAKEKGYTYVFDISQSTLVYFDGNDDLLVAVKKKLGITAATTTGDLKK